MMKKKKIVAVAVVLALVGGVALFLGLHGRSSSTAHAGSDASSPLNESADGQTVQANTGDAITIALQENPSTGYAWAANPTPDPAVLKLESSDFMGDPAGATGAAGTRQWVFRASGAGKAAVRLEYKRGFEKTKPPSKTFSLTVDVAK